MSDNHQGASPETAEPEKIIGLTDTTVKAGTAAATDLERKRHIVVRALQIAQKQLEDDAEKLERSAILNEIPMKQRHEMFDLARALRMTTGWLNSLTGEGPAEDGK